MGCAPVGLLGVLTHASEGVCCRASLLPYSLALFDLREHSYKSSTSKESKRVNRATYMDTLLLCSLAHSSSAPLLWLSVGSGFLP